MEATVPAGREAGSTGVKRERFLPEYRISYLLDLKEMICSRPTVAASWQVLRDGFTEMGVGVSDAYLLPVLGQEDYPAIAKAFLRRYYPEALEEAAAVDGRQLALRMGLKVRHVRLESGSEAMGLVTFDRMRVKLEDAEGRVTEESIPPMTVLINTALCRTEEAENTTLVHECCHVYLDRLFFRLQMLSGKPCTVSMSRRRPGAPRAVRAAGPLAWMETQAEKLPAYILIQQPVADRAADGGGRRGTHAGEHRAGHPPSGGGLRGVAQHGAVPDDRAGVSGGGGRIRVPGQQADPGSRLRRGVAGRGQLYHIAGGRGRAAAGIRRLSARAGEQAVCVCGGALLPGRAAVYPVGQRAGKEPDRLRAASHGGMLHRVRGRRVPGRHRRGGGVGGTQEAGEGPVSDAVQLCSRARDEGREEGERAVRGGCPDVGGAGGRWCTRGMSLRHVVAICIALDVWGHVGENLVRLAGYSFRMTDEQKILHMMLYDTKDLTVARANGIMRQHGMKPLTEGREEEF